MQYDVNEVFQLRSYALVRKIQANCFCFLGLFDCCIELVFGSNKQVAAKKTNLVNLTKGSFRWWPNTIRPGCLGEFLFYLSFLFSAALIGIMRQKGSYSYMVLASPFKRKLPTKSIDFCFCYKLAAS